MEEIDLQLYRPLPINNYRINCRSGRHCERVSSFTCNKLGSETLLTKASVYLVNKIGISYVEAIEKASNRSVNGSFAIDVFKRYSSLI
jgi:hypothetical protein